MRILALTHGDNVGPGVFEDAAAAAGHELVERNVARPCCVRVFSCAMFSPIVACATCPWASARFACRLRSMSRVR